MQTVEERKQTQTSTMMHSAADQRHFREWSDNHQFDTEGRIDDKEACARRNSALGILSGNTLANCDHNEFRTTIKAPRKERKRMNSSKRFKIFGSMKKTGTRKKESDRDAREPAEEERQYDELALGRRMYLRDVVGGDPFMESRDSSLLHSGYADGVHRLPMTQYNMDKNEVHLPADQNDFDWDENELNFLSKSIEDESDLSNVFSSIHGSRSRSQSTHRSMASKKGIPMNQPKVNGFLLPHPRSRSRSNSRSISRVSRSNFIQSLQEAETAALNGLQNPSSCSSRRPQSTHMVPPSMFHSTSSRNNQDNILALAQARSRSRSTSNSRTKSSNLHRISTMNNLSNADENGLTSRKMIQIPLRKTYLEGNNENVYNHIHHRSRDQTKDQTLDDDSNSHVSALSMTSPTEASNKKTLNQMLSISFSDYENGTKNKSNTEYNEEEIGKPSFFCGLPMKSNYQLDSEESSCGSSSEERSSSVAELILRDDVLLPSTSSLTSQSTDVPNSDDEEEEESSDDEARGGEEDSSCNNPSKTSIFEPRKILTAIQGKLSDCFLPVSKSPPSYHSKTMFV